MADAENVAVPEKKKKNKVVLWLVIGAAVLLMAGGGYVAIKHFRAPQQAAQVAGAGGEAGAASKVKSVMCLDAFLVKLADVESTRFVKVTFRLGLDEPGVGEEYAGNAVVLAATRDRIISILSAKAADDILSLEGKQNLRNEIREEINPVLPKGKIVEVFIMDFVMQL